MTTPQYADEPRPRPLYDVATRVAAWRALLALLLGTGGLLPWALTAEQLDTLAVLCALGGLALCALMSALAAFGVVRRGEPLVTPLSSPQGADGTALVSEAAARALAAAALSRRPDLAPGGLNGTGGVQAYPGSSAAGEPWPWFDPRDAG